MISFPNCCAISWLKHFGTCCYWKLINAAVYCDSFELCKYTIVHQQLNMTHLYPLQTQTTELCIGLGGCSLLPRDFFSFFRVRGKGFLYPILLVVWACLNMVWQLRAIPVSSFLPCSFMNWEVLSLFDDKFYQLWFLGQTISLKTCLLFFYHC